MISAFKEFDRKARQETARKKNKEFADWLDGLQGNGVWHTNRMIKEKIKELRKNEN